MLITVEEILKFCTRLLQFGIFALSKTKRGMIQNDYLFGFFLLLLPSLFKSKSSFSFFFFFLFPSEVADEETMAVAQAEWEKNNQSVGFYYYFFKIGLSSSFWRFFCYRTFWPFFLPFFWLRLCETEGFLVVLWRLLWHSFSYAQEILSRSSNPWGGRNLLKERITGRWLRDSRRIGED